MSEAREVIAQAAWEFVVDDDELTALADCVLAALEAEGLRVVRLEQVGQKLLADGYRDQAEAAAYIAEITSTAQAETLEPLYRVLPASSSEGSTPHDG